VRRLGDELEQVRTLSGIVEEGLVRVAQRAGAGDAGDAGILRTEDGGAADASGKGLDLAVGGRASLTSSLRRIERTQQPKLTWAAFVNGSQDDAQAPASWRLVRAWTARNESAVLKAESIVSVRTGPLLKRTQGGRKGASEDSETHAGGRERQRAWR
jgi:hypothetical protein